jgi:predicted nucleic acid-binding protein
MSETAFDPACWTRQLVRRPDADLPFDPAGVAAGAAILPDSCFYLDALKGLVPEAVASLVRTPLRRLLHSTICRAELSAGAAKLPPSDARTPASRTRIAGMLERMPKEQLVQPTANAWDEAGALAGTLARTQGFAKGAHLALVLDAAILLTAMERNAVVVTANVADFDLLLQLRPRASVLFYRPGSSLARGRPVEVGRSVARRVSGSIR